MGIFMDAKKNVVVSGAGGFIGSYLCRELYTQGYKVYGIYYSEKEIINDDNIQPIVVNLLNEKEVESKLQGIDIEYFFHLAHNGVNGKVKSDYSVQLQNTLMTCNLVNLLCKLGCKRFIYAGSVDEFQAFNKPDAAYGKPDNSRIYAMAKYAAEQIGKDVAYRNNMEFVELLNPMVFGPGNKTNILPNVIMSHALRNMPVKLITGSNKFDMIYIKDCVNAFIAIATKGKNMESYYSGHHTIHTFKDFVIDLCNTLKLNVDLRFGEYPDVDPSFDYDLINLTKLTDDTGFECNKDLGKQFTETFEWIKNTGFETSI